MGYQYLHVVAISPPGNVLVLDQLSQFLIVSFVLDHNMYRSSKLSVISMKRCRSKLSVFSISVTTIIYSLHVLGEASSQQALMVLRCTGALMVKEHPDARHKLFQQLWEKLPQFGNNFVIHTCINTFSDVVQSISSFDIKLLCGSCFCVYLISSG